MAVADYVTQLLSSHLKPDICAHRVFAAHEAQYAENKRPWIKPIENLLAAKHIRLYSHQALATDLIRAGHSVCVSTPTASGKSLIYNLPVLEQFFLDPEAHALYLFPLKALAQDQLLGIHELTKDWPKASQPTTALYDGDTTVEERRRIREKHPTILFTNPEMLHLAILPWHEQWTEFLANLRIIVVDEAHTYRGVFGSNMALVFRRLNRIVARYGHTPSYVLCTATLGNPAELASQLINAEHSPDIITESGAPQGARHFFILNPTTSAASTTAITLLKLALKENLRTIVYCKSRKMTELISIWAGSDKNYKKQISAYRAGFLPEERREIEAKMNSGDLKCVVSTSALELGIDIGGLDICILVGYPGSVMSTLQRAGRVGRAKQESVVIIITAEDMLDQYFANNPDEFFSRTPEKAVLNPDNEVIAKRHLICAAQELALDSQEDWLQSSAMQKVLATLIQENELFKGKDHCWYTARKQPQRSVSLRGTGQQCHIEDENATLIGSLDTFRIFREAHEGAVYLHRGKSYVIQKVDLATQRIVAKQERVAWFTKPRAQKSTVILQEYARKSLGRSVALFAKLRITDLVTAYEKRSNHDNRLLSVQNLHCPPQIFETEGICYIIPDAIRLAIENEYLHFMGSIHALEHAIIGIIPLQVMADRLDFGGISIPLHPQVGLPCVFVYDGIPAGCGLTREAYGHAKELLEDTFNVVSHCPCLDGCPSCVHSPKCGSGNRPISKQGAILLLKHLLDEGDEGTTLCNTLTLSQATPPPEHPTGQPKTSTMPKKPPERFVVFDVETRHSAQEVGGWHNAKKMEVSVVVAYESKTDRFLAFQQHELKDLFALFAKAELIVGFNSLNFDYKVLEPFTEMDLWKLPSLDILEQVQKTLHYRLSLNTLCKATLDVQKKADGIQALQWWKEGKMTEIISYCKHDVQLTLDLY
ncbi:MAG: DEAD/DEAH box helicase, partial [Desulfovibrio sp.]|nr:DEAD/DEAH box helicase [Desulfovibrio sp.]